MKLKTKFQNEDFELGEIVDADICYSGDTRNGFKVVAESNLGGLCSFYYNSIEELTDNWEDAPGKYWYYDTISNEIEETHILVDKEKDEEIGNYFETKEEAEKAVEKLKAWKRLKDKGVEFYGWRKNPTGTYDFLARWEDIPPKMHDIIDDLDLLFGGEK